MKLEYEVFNRGEDTVVNCRFLFEIVLNIVLGLRVRDIGVRESIEGEVGVLIFIERWRYLEIESIVEEKREFLVSNVFFFIIVKVV